MAIVKVKRKHHLGAKDARATVDKLAKKLEKELDAKCHWEGSRLVFTRSGAAGHIDVSDSDVLVELKLGMLLRPMKGKIQKTIEEEIDKYLVV
mgnify:FL=1